ncbi:bacterio-opsin activator domain-containing protein [Natronorubrum sp. FCH18a]|uniref:bacterio-opsin activator domain-containing protein n=1 Tax=Natronorubrum sp. FCH18a TaxID=3447018 RepID=UPI003F50D849
MSPENSAGSIIHLTTTRSSSLQTRLRDDTPYAVRSISPEPTLEDVLTNDSESGSRSEEDAQSPIAVVIEHDDPEATVELLERCHAVDPAVPTIVVPETGSEALATAALRAHADEYVSATADEDPVERILETIRSSQETSAEAKRAHSSERGVDRDYRQILANELPDEAFVISEDGTYLEAKVRPDAAELHTKPADELTGEHLQNVFPDDVAATLQACIDRTLRTGDIQSIEYSAETTEGRRQFEARVVPIDERIDGQRAVVWLARDITERARRERELRSRQDQLETLNRISTVVGRVIDTLVEAPSQDTIEREVCEQLVDSELYCGSWIAERTGEGTLSYRTGAGDAETFLGEVEELDAGHEWLGQRAVRTGAIQTAMDVQETETVPEPLREAAREDDIRSAITVPIEHNDSIYGVLTVLASRDEAVSDDELAGFALLGETIGFTIMAVKNRQLLFADTVVELEFRIDGGDTFAFDLSEEYGCRCSLEWAGTTSSGRTVQYVTVDGVGGETVLEAANDHQSIEECRLIHDGDNSCTIEMRLSESGVRTLANHGATIRDVTVENGVGTCVIEVPQDADVREIAEALTVVYENTQLVARREVDRSVQTAAERRNRILDQLTDRQLTTLRLAYYSGFFDWPRESTGEDIADAMGVSPPTMHQHLRKGLKAVLCEFFDVDGGPE